MLRRREMLESMGGELYPVGTDIIGKYIGRNARGLANFVPYTIINLETGAYEEGDLGASPVYMPINPDYTYQKGSKGRIYRLAYYAADYTYISSIIHSSLDKWVITDIPANARYCRVCTHRVDSNWGLTITRIA